MDYKAEPLETNFGKGVRVKKGRRSYEQFNCKDGLFARVYQAPSKKNGKLDTNYHGVIFRAPFQDTNQDYEQFKVLAERLQQASGKKVPNSNAHFMGYISYSGLEQELSRIGANVRINLKDREKLPKEASRWIRSKSHLVGLISDVSLYLGGFALIANTVSGADLTKALIGYGISTSAIEGLLGTSVSGILTWCGPLHSLGFVPSFIIYKNKLRQPEYILNKFMQNYQRLNIMTLSVGQYAKQSKKADRHFGVLEDMFPFTKHQKGFSITYDAPDRDNVIRFFDYVLEGGNAPQLPNSQTRVKNKKLKAQKKPVEIEPVETNFINPWEAQIPKLEGKKNE